MFRFIFLIAAVAVVESFSQRLKIETKSSTSRIYMADKKQEISFPIGEPSNVDISRAKDCAEHFGKCSMKEVRKLKNDLHNERVRNYVFGNPDELTQEEQLEHRIFEEELDLQLSLLENQDKEQTLFPEVAEVKEMEELPILKEGTLQETVKLEQQNFLAEQLFMEENVVETLIICSFIAFLMVLPQLN